MSAEHFQDSTATEGLGTYTLHMGNAMMWCPPYTQES